MNLTPGMAYLIASTALYSTNHWIGGTVMLVMVVLMEIKDR